VCVQYDRGGGGRVSSDVALNFLWQQVATPAPIQSIWHSKRVTAFEARCQLIKNKTSLKLRISHMAINLYICMYFIH